jgi:hypothetical protein
MTMRLMENDEAVCIAWSANFNVMGMSDLSETF